MRRSGLLYTFLSCHTWIEPSLAPPIMRRPKRRKRKIERERLREREGVRERERERERER